MTEHATKLPVKKVNETLSAAKQPTSTFEALRREVDRLFDSFDVGAWRFPFRAALDFAPLWESAPILGAPNVDIAETEKAYKVTAELPGLDDKDIEVKISDSILTIQGEKKEEREEKKADYHLSERRYGSFQRRFALPTGVDAGKIEAQFKNGVLSVTLPKTAEAQMKEKKIAIKAA